MSLIQFGCWNQGYCDINDINNGMSAVMQTLVNDVEAPTFYIVAGDNYYPYEKTNNGEKIFNARNLVSGFTCTELLAEKAPVYMLMGNHDLQYENNMVSTDGVKVDKCSIIETEMNYASRFNFDSYSAILGENTICLFINSILYTSDREEAYDCMVKYRKEYRDIETIDAITDFDEMVLHELLDILMRKYDFENIIISGHDPIVTRREKLGKIKNGEMKPGKSVRKPLDARGIEFLDSLYSKLPNANKYYLCADTHQYQKAYIKIGTHNITQYVVGTGGTNCDLDEIQIDEDFVAINKFIQYKLVESEKSFGFLHVTTIDDKLNFNFNKVVDCDINRGGGKRKTRRIKRRGKRTRRKRKY